MPWTDTAPSLPFSGSETVSRENSRRGARAAAPQAGSQSWRLLELYQDSGPKTDHEASAALSLPLATICARRGYLRERGLVVAVGSKTGDFGVLNTLYGCRP